MLRNSLLGKVFVALALSQSLAFSAAFSAGAVDRELDAPCIPGTNDEEIKRLKAQGAHAGERACKVVLREADQKLEKRVRDQAEQYYDGCDLDPTQAPNAQGCRGRTVPRETCNVLSNGVPGTFGGNELATNHKGRSCGDWPYFNSRLSGRTCSITPDYTRTSHFIEDSYNRGGWIQAMNCYHNQVKAEVARGKLRLTTVRNAEGAEVNGPCAAMAQQFDWAKREADASVSSAAVAKANEQSLTGEANIADVEMCTGAERSKVEDENPDVGRLRQSACQLVAARQNLEAMWMQLAACEVFSRAQRSYERFMGGPSPTGDDVTAAARRAIHGIRSKNRSMCSHNRVLEQWYKPNYFSRFHAKADAIWNAEACR